MRRVALLLLVAGLAPAPAFAQPSRHDQAYAGYQQLYTGDELGAIKYFQNLLAPNPDDLAFRFGLLSAQQARLDRDVPLRAEFERRLDAFIGLADKRYARTTRDEEALFYLAQAHLMRARYRVDYDKGMWGAARDGVKSRSYSLAYLKVHPEHGDAYLALGLYNYYVELAPAFFKVIRFLLFLPAGNRAEGLKQIERSASQGSLFGPQAQELLIEVYSQYEGRVADAVTTADRLLERYPGNDDFAFTVAELYSSAAVDDHRRAGEIYQRVADRRKGDESGDAPTTYYRALLNLANTRMSEWRPAEAVAVLTPSIDARVARPGWVLPNLLLARANYRALLDDPAAADDARRVQGDPAMAEQKPRADGLLKWMDARKASGEAAIFAALIPAQPADLRRQVGRGEACVRGGRRALSEQSVDSLLAGVSRVRQRERRSGAARVHRALERRPRRPRRHPRVVAVVHRADARSGRPPRRGEEGLSADRGYLREPARGRSGAVRPGDAI